MEFFQSATFFDIHLFPHANLFADCHYVWEALSKLPSYLRSHTHNQLQEAKVSPQAYLVHPETISLGKGTVVEAGAYIQGPCIIGKNCVIRNGAYLRGNVITGDGCVIGHCTELKNVIFLQEVHAAHFAYIGDSIIGNNVNMGAGVKCANLKFNNSEVVVHYHGQHFATGLRKCGAFIGDNSHLGCNSVTNPGTFLGKGSTLYPCVCFGGVAAANSSIQFETKTYITNK